MGTSTDGILFYGFSVGEDENAEIIRGMDGNGEYVVGSEDEEPDEDAIWAHHFKLDPDPDKVEKVWRHKEKHVIQIGTHCSYDYPMYYVAIRKSVLSASRGTPEKVDTLEIGKDWDKQLKEFCDLWELEPPNEFGWYLCSLWG